MQVRQLAHGMTDQLVNGPGDFSPLDVRHQSVVQRADDGSRKSLDSVTMDDDEIGWKLAHEMAEPLNCVREHQIHLGVDRSILIDVRIDMFEPARVDLAN